MQLRSLLKMDMIIRGTGRRDMREPFAMRAELLHPQPAAQQAMAGLRIRKAQPLLPRAQPTVTASLSVTHLAAMVIGQALAVLWA